MNVPQDLRYAASHEWVRDEGDGTVAVGISDHAQEALGDLVFIDLPKIGRQVKAGEAVAVVESVKAASDIYAPMDGEVIAQNEALKAEPEKVNADAYAHWLFKLRPAKGGTSIALMDAAAYTASVEGS